MDAGRKTKQGEEIKLRKERKGRMARGRTRACIRAGLCVWVPVGAYLQAVGRGQGRPGKVALIGREALGARGHEDWGGRRRPEDMGVSQGQC